MTHRFVFRTRETFLAATVLLACAPPTASQQGGTIAFSASTNRLFVADEDNGGVEIVDPGASSGSVAFLPTGNAPGRVILRSGNVFVSNRLSRTVTQISEKSPRIVRQIPVGAEPEGMDTTSDGLLIVANAMSQTVQAVQIATGATVWTTSVGDEIHSVAALPDGRIYAPGFSSGQMHVLDGKSGTAQASFTFQQPPDDAAGFDCQPTSVESILSDGAGRVYLPHSQSGLLQLPSLVTLYYATGVLGPPVSPGITTVQTTGNALQIGTAFDLTGGTPSKASYPAPALHPTEAFAGPRVAAMDGSGNNLYVVNFLSQNVAEVSATRSGHAVGAVSSLLAGGGVTDLIAVGQGPNGIAVVPASDDIYVYNSFDHDISVLGHDTSGALTVKRTIGNISANPLSAAVRNGRQLFNTASDPRVSLQGQGGVSCASCHPNGRADGHVWQLAEGPRKTPMLSGRLPEQTGPWHWDGALVVHSDLVQVLGIRMGGTGVQASDYDDLFTYMESLPAPDNPNRAADGSLTSDQLEGQAIFEGAASCISCHTGPTLTDNKFWDVGTHFMTISLDQEVNGYAPPSERTPALPNTPSLRSVFATAPYLHDGSIATLEDRIQNNPGDRHGVTSNLTPTEVAQLAAYLRTL